jgi:transposase InsO family protein
MYYGIRVSMANTKLSFRWRGAFPSLHRCTTMSAMPATLFGKVYIDMMFMPKAGGFCYVVHARCSVSSYPEARMLRSENHKTLADFIFQDILCRWGAIQTIVTDNGQPFIATLNSLAKRYGINHIRISSYNTQANGLVKRKHWDLRQALYKITNSVESKWHRGFYAALWAEHMTPRQTMGYSPYFAAHGLHPILPFNIDKATYLLPPPDKILTTEDLIVCQARQLQRQLTNIDDLCKKVHQA